MTRSGLAAAALLTTAAAWLSQGTLAVSSLDGSRIGLLPVSPFAWVTALAAGAAVAGFARAGALARTDLAAGVHRLSVVAVARAGGVSRLERPYPLADLDGGRHRDARHGRRGPRPSRGGWRNWLPVVVALVRDRPRSMAGALAFAIFAFAAWQVSPSVPGGDEPHYLVITQSLLLDGDLKIENNHKRGDYQVYYAGRLAPHYIRRGANGEIYSIHAPGVSALVAPAFAIGGIPRRRAVSARDRGVRQRARMARRLAGVGAAVGGLVRMGGSHAVGDDDLSQLSPSIPMRVGGVIALTGVWALLRADDERRTGEARVWPWFLHGAALALLPWLHSRFALLAGSLGALVLLRLSSTKNPAGKAVAFLSIPAVSAIGWMGFLRRDLRRRGSFGAIRHWPGLLDRVHSRRAHRVALRPEVRPSCQCSRSRRWRRRTGDDASAATGRRRAITGTRRSSPGDRAALRHGSVPVDGDQLRDVVGRVERAGAVCQPCGSDPRDSLRGGVAVDPEPRDAGHRRRTRWR